jgi:hypothetical protein
MTPIEETPLDTFVQLVSQHFSGLIAIVRSQDARLSTFENRESRRAMKDQKPIPVCEWKNSHCPAEADLMAIAEWELGAFMRAVTGLFGSEQARLAAEDWVDELELMEALPGPTGRDWGSVTVAASAQLARRLSADVDLPTPRVGSTDTRVPPIPSSNCFGPTGLA